MPTTSYRYNPRTFAYLYREPGLGIGQLAEVELCFEQPGAEHKHGNWQIMILLDGEVTVTAEGVTHALEPGGVCLVPPLLPHLTQPPAGLPRFTLIDLRLMPMPATPLAEHLAQTTRGRVVSWKVDPDEIDREAKALRRVLTRLERPASPYVMAPLWRMLAPPLDEAALFDAPPPVPDSRVLFAVAVMRERIADPLSIEHLADRVQLSTSQLGRLFKEHLDTTPHAYLQQLRLEQARQYLTSSRLSIKQIAAACGFGSPHHFSRLFHQEVGMTATDFRRRHDGEAP